MHHTALHRLDRLSTHAMRVLAGQTPCKSLECRAKKFSLALFLSTGSTEHYIMLHQPAGPSTHAARVPVGQTPLTSLGNRARHGELQPVHAGRAALERQRGIVMVSAVGLRRRSSFGKLLLTHWRRLALVRTQYWSISCSQRSLGRSGV